MNENDKQYTELGRLYAEWFELNEQRKAAKEWRRKSLYESDGEFTEENQQAHREYTELAQKCAIAKRAVTRLAKKVVTP